MQPVTVHEIGPKELFSPDSVRSLQQPLLVAILGGNDDNPISLPPSDFGIPRDGLEHLRDRAAQMECPCLPGYRSPLPADGRPPVPIRLQPRL